MLKFIKSYLLFFILEQKISDQNIDQLSKEHITELFPKIGERVEFEKQLNIWKSSVVVSKILISFPFF